HHDRARDHVRRRVRVVGALRVPPGGRRPSEPQGLSSRHLDRALQPPGRQGPRVECVSLLGERVHGGARARRPRERCRLRERRASERGLHERRRRRRTGGDLTPVAGMYSVEIDVPSLPPASFLLRRISGRDEVTLEPERAGEPTRLLAALLAGPGGASIDVTGLLASYHDRLLAEVFRHEVGEAITCHVACSECSEPFQLELMLSEGLAAQDRDAAAVGRPGADGRWPVAGTRVRPPTLRDTVLLDSDAVVEVLCAPAPAAEDRDAVLALLESAAPLL